MIWHIVKKDSRLLWPLALLIGALEWILDAIMLSRGRFDMRIIAPYADAGRSAGLMNLVSVVGSLGMALLVIVIVQQDSLPGVRADWLVRPIKRRDLLLAKLLSVIILVTIPTLLGDVAEGLAYGFSAKQSFGAALWRSGHMLATTLIPVFAVAAVTKNLLEAIVGASVIEVGVQLISSFMTGYNFMLAPYAQISTAWIDYFVNTMALLAGATALILFQYFRRKTLIARVMVVAIALAVQLIPRVSSANALAIQRRLSPDPQAGKAIHVEFVADRSAAVERMPGPFAPQNSGDIFVVLPMRVTGLPNPSVLYGDGSRVKLILASGEVIDLRYQMGLQIRREFVAGGADQQVIELRGPGGGSVTTDRGFITDKPVTWGIRVPLVLYRRIKDEPVRVEIEYALSLIGLADEQHLLATGGDSRSKALGWCGTRLDEEGSRVLVGCVQASERTGCTSFVLIHKPSGIRNTAQTNCMPSYSPFRFGSHEPDAFNRIGIALGYGDGGPNARVDVVQASMIGESEVIARVFRARDHFTRNVVIPEIRLADWAKE
jgi:hypothetical protein